MTFSHWGKTIIAEKHSAVMRWVTTTIDQTDSKVALHRLVETDVLSPQVASFLLFELKGTSAPETDIFELQISLDQISKHVLTAYERTYAYLLTPQQFVADLLASLEGAALDGSFFSKLDACKEYDYFPDMLRAWGSYLKEQGSGFVTRTELVVKLHEIDQLILRYATISVLVDLLEPVYDFHRHLSGDPTLPGSELALFFDDKGGLSQTVQEFTAHADKHFNLREAVEVISKMLGTGIPVADVIETEVVAEPEYPQTQYDSFLQDLHEAGVPVSNAPELEEKVFPSIELFINKKLRERTIRNVFYGNKTEYKRFITFINGSSSMDKALLNLETTLRMQRVDLTSKTAQRLRNALTSRFHQHN